MAYPEERRVNLKLRATLLLTLALATALCTWVLLRAVVLRAQTPAADTTAVLVGAGDIADCKDLSGAEATAKLLEKISGTVMAIGDLAYPDGTAQDFECYERTWGRLNARTRPAPGNHEFHTAAAAYYFQYFAAMAGDPAKGYYSYE